MAERAGRLQRRRWADVLVIVVGVYALILSLYGGILGRPGAVALQVADPGWYFAATGLAGVLALASVLVALRSRMFGRALSAAAGVVLLSGLFAVTSIDLAAVIELLLPAALLFAATPFLGAMPAPEEEGRRR
ncbi:MAG TPA: hypothetical protein VF158_04895 [Longimicrobiales bacterium]